MFGLRDRLPMLSSLTGGSSPAKRALGLVFWKITLLYIGVIQGLCGRLGILPRQRRIKWRERKVYGDGAVPKLKLGILWRVLAK